MTSADDNSKLYSYISASPVGISAGDLHKHFLEVSRPTINRWLKDALGRGIIVTEGKGSATIYKSADQLLSIKRYFEQSQQERAVARYQESLLLHSQASHLLLEVNPHLEILKSNAAHDKLDKREFVQFLIDFSCASSALEGGTYSQLDTQALIQYGEVAEGKSIEDAFLILNHKRALEYLYANLSLSSAVEVHRLMTDDHNLPELQGSIHFLNKEKMGIREYDEVNIQTTTYHPPFRPGTGYIKKMFNQIIETAESIADPVDSAFYLFSRIPYLQPFSDGNKRTARALCNVPLLRAGLPPISFIDFSKRDYIISMLSFYELGDTRYAEKTFAKSYLKSINRLPKPSVHTTIKPK
ncbi:MAG: hypothetical protein CTY35_00540 [Methylotenera sp.]|uniref:Fic family protein n=1 Tax=Methylotenera sp. TaxID=2051956 RepID=UPI000D49D41F|nr:Fic family protein [Methylotenera sp.]PPC84843.1 MAG: hypothetical protein CTY38_00535 [Methylotenera sp.]PPD02203.1 MAG: hypothetical protein CTY35_00540 [Methylotenera sp.]